MKDDIFKIEKEPPVVMSKDEFFEKTTALLQKILDEYSGCWYTRSLKESDHPEESVCDQCKGCGVFKLENGEERDCFQDREIGECYYRDFDAEEFGLGIQGMLELIHELSLVDELKK